MELTEKQKKQKMVIRRHLQAALQSFDELSVKERQMIIARYGFDQLWAWKPRSLHEAAGKTKSNPESVRLAEEKLVKLMLTRL